ncbi:hypothetical protein [Sinorhizobium medicae]
MRRFLVQINLAKQRKRTGVVAHAQEQRASSSLMRGASVSDRSNRRPSMALSSRPVPASVIALETGVDLGRRGGNRSRRHAC